MLSGLSLVHPHPILVVELRGMRAEEKVVAPKEEKIENKEKAATESKPVTEEKKENAAESVSKAAQPPKAEEAKVSEPEKKEEKKSTPVVESKPMPQSKPVVENKVVPQGKAKENPEKPNNLFEKNTAPQNFRNNDRQPQGANRPNSNSSQFKNDRFAQYPNGAPRNDRSNQNQQRPQGQGQKAPYGGSQRGNNQGYNNNQRQAGGFFDKDERVQSAPKEKFKPQPIVRSQTMKGDETPKQ